VSEGTRVLNNSGPYMKVVHLSRFELTCEKTKKFCWLDFLLSKLLFGIKLQNEKIKDVFPQRS